MQELSEFKVGDVINGMEIIHLAGDAYQCMKNGKMCTFSAENKRKYRKYEIRCTKCGHVGRVTHKSLKDGCVGCRKGPCNAQFKDLTGMVFGNLTVLEYIPKKDDENYIGVKWKCRCSCGAVFITYSASILAQNKTSCTPCSMKRRAKVVSLSAQNSAWNRYYSVTRSNARRKGREFLLSIEEYKRLSTQNCYYCGCSPSGDCKGLVRIGIDRFDNNQGYTVENSRPCCIVCNKMKAQLSYDGFINHLKKIINKAEETKTAKDLAIDFQSSPVVPLVSAPVKK